MDAPNEVARPRPVFLDETGMRRRAMRWSGTAVGAVFLTYLALLVASFARAPFVRQLSLPGTGSPAPGQTSHPPSLGDDARTSPAPDLRVTVPPMSPPASTTTTLAARSVAGSPGTTAVSSASTATTAPGSRSTPSTVSTTPTTVATPTTTTTAPPATTTTTTARGNGRTTGRTTTTNPRRP